MSVTNVTIRMSSKKAPAVIVQYPPNLAFPPTLAIKVPVGSLGMSIEEGDQLIRDLADALAVARAARAEREAARTP